MKKRVLLLETPRPFDAVVTPVLSRSEIEVDRLGGSFAVLELVSRVRFDLIVIGAELREPGLVNFIEEIRSPGSPCRSSSVIVVTEAGQQALVNGAMSAGANSVINWPANVFEVLPEFNRLLNVAPRMSARLITKLAVQITTGWKKLFAKSENISVSGMLVEVGDSLEVGSELQVEFSLPGQAEPIRCQGNVVRQAGSNGGVNRRIGIRFVEYAGDSKLRLASYISKG